MSHKPQSARRRLSLAPAAGIALAALLAGCAPLPPKIVVHEVRVEVPVQVEVPVVLPADAAARQLLQAHARLRRLSPAELAAEVRPRDDASLTPQASTELALALMLNHGIGELARAQSLLDQVQRDTRPDAIDWQPLARMLADTLVEPRRLEDQSDKQAQQLREIQRKLDLANEKLEALKAIERSLGTSRGTSGDRP